MSRVLHSVHIYRSVIVNTSKAFSSNTIHTLPERSSHMYTMAPQTRADHCDTNVATVDCP